MAFALSITHLIDAMREPGCPICRLFQEASERAVESFLWENVNDPEIRQGIIDSLGFCPPHTRLMVAQELSSSSAVLGTNIIYEHLGRLVAGDLRRLRPVKTVGNMGGVGSWLRKLGLLAGSKPPLSPKGICPVCEAGSNAANNSLFVLIEELRKDGDVRETYLKSDGLCLAHLRTAAELHSGRFPEQVTLLLEDAGQRLVTQSADMKEYIRKNNWAYRDEKMTEAEDTAWRKTLTFFTGFRGSKFTHKIDD